MAKTSLAIVLCAGLAACGGSHVVLVPPAVDLAAYEPIGLVTFTVENARGDLDEYATQLFLQQITRSQQTPVLEMGKLDAVLAKIHAKSLDPETDKAIRETYGVKSFFLGSIKISKTKPSVDLTAALNQRLRIRTSTDITATARLVSAETGATLWTNSTTLNGTLGLLGAGAGETPYVSVRDQDQATRDFLRELLYELTWDFRPTRRRI
jgi:hypothetical protein